MATKTKNTKKIGKIIALLAVIFAPVAAVSASTVQISVSIAPVASIEVQSEKDGNNIKYTATVTTNSVNGFDVYASSVDKEDWTLVKSVSHYPSDEERIVTATSTDKELKFTAIPRV
jgi:uncharacterized protein YpmB